MPTECN